MASHYVNFLLVSFCSLLLVFHKPVYGFCSSLIVKLWLSVHCPVVGLLGKLAVDLLC